MKIRFFLILAFLLAATQLYATEPAADQEIEESNEELDAALMAELDAAFDTMTGTIADLQGNWSTSCTAEDPNSLFTIERLVISGNTLYREATLYPDSNCESPMMQLNEAILSVNLDGSTQFTDETSGYKVSGKLLSADLTVLNSDFASTLNEQNVCGIDSWEKDVAFDIFGKNCGNEDEIAIKNAVTYAAYRVTGNNLYFERSESEYPTSLDENKIYVRQFHLSSADQDPNLCYTPDGKTRAPDWVCGAPVAGYSEVGVGVYQTDVFSEEEDYFSSLTSAFALAFADANLAILKARGLYSGKMKSKIIEKFFTPTEVYILVAEAPDGSNYKLDEMVTEVLGGEGIDSRYTRAVRMIKYNADESEVVWCYQYYLEIENEDVVDLLDNFNLGTCQ